MQDYKIIEKNLKSTKFQLFDNHEQNKSPQSSNLEICSCCRDGEKQR